MNMPFLLPFLLPKPILPFLTSLLLPMLMQLPMHMLAPLQLFRPACLQLLLVLLKQLFLRVELSHEMILFFKLELDKLQNKLFHLVFIPVELLSLVVHFVELLGEDLLRFEQVQVE